MYQFLLALNKEKKLNQGIYLLILTCLCFALSLFRVYLSGTKTFLFLNWNLFLAFVPWVLTSIIIVNNHLKHKSIVIAFLLFTWLLFFPNAPYILTDLFHLRLNSNIPLWYDLVLILTFAWTGLLYGFLSLFDIEKIFVEKFKIKWISFLSSILLFVTSFGIYLGRYLRWNSWDILNNPMGLFNDILHRFTFPMEHPRTWGVTIFMGILLNIMYWSFKFIKKNNI